MATWTVEYQGREGSASHRWNLRGLRRRAQRNFLVTFLFLDRVVEVAKSSFVAYPMLVVLANHPGVGMQISRAGVRQRSLPLTYQQTLQYRENLADILGRWQLWAYWGVETGRRLRIYSSWWRLWIYTVSVVFASPPAVDNLVSFSLSDIAVAGWGTPDIRAMAISLYPQRALMRFCICGRWSPPLAQLPLALDITQDREVYRKVPTMRCSPSSSLQQSITQWLHPKIPTSPTSSTLLVYTSCVFLTPFYTARAHEVHAQDDDGVFPPGTVVTRSDDHDLQTTLVKQQDGTYHADDSTDPAILGFPFEVRPHLNGRRRDRFAHSDYARIHTSISGPSRRFSTLLLARWSPSMSSNPTALGSLHLPPTLRRLQMEVFRSMYVYRAQSSVNVALNALLS